MAEGLFAHHQTFAAGYLLCHLVADGGLQKDIAIRNPPDARALRSPPPTSPPAPPAPIAQALTVPSLPGPQHAPGRPPMPLATRLRTAVLDRCSVGTELGGPLVRRTPTCSYT